MGRVGVLLESVRVVLPFANGVWKSWAISGSFC